MTLGRYAVTDAEGCGYDREVEACDPKEAAKTWAELTFALRDYQCDTVCIVTDKHGNATRWGIETDAMPIFRAAYIGVGYNADQKGDV